MSLWSSRIHENSVLILTFFLITDKSNDLFKLKNETAKFAVRNAINLLMSTAAKKQTTPSVAV